MVEKYGVVLVTRQFAQVLRCISHVFRLSEQSKADQFISQAVLLTASLTQSLLMPDFLLALGVIEFFL